MHITFSSLDNHSIGESEKLCKTILFYNFDSMVSPTNNKYNFPQRRRGGATPKTPPLDLLLPL